MLIKLQQVRELLADSTTIDDELKNFKNKQSNTIGQAIQNISSLNLARSLGNIDAEISHQLSQVSNELIHVREFLNYQIRNYFIINSNAKESIDSLVSKINETYKTVSNLTTT